MQGSLQKIVDPGVDVLATDGTAQATHAIPPFVRRHRKRLAYAFRGSLDVMGIYQDRTMLELGRGTAANSDSTSTLFSASEHAQYSLATRFMPSFNGVTSPTEATR